MKLSLIISSYNQKNRLKFSLQSALNQKTKVPTIYEVIVADDNSTDGTDELIKEYFRTAVIVCKNKYSKKDTYTLANNWNTAVKEVATGDRVIFTNGDIIFSKGFIEAHADPIMDGHIIFGPGLSTASPVGELVKACSDYKEIVKIAEEKKWLLPDRHAEGSAYTYNIEWKYWFPFGYNFSVMRGHFLGVDGFPSIEKWGGEERDLCKKIVEKYNCKVLSNVNAYAIHLWHPAVNYEGKITRDNYEF